jgi:hypothetical protein
MASVQLERAVRVHWWKGSLVELNKRMAPKERHVEFGETRLPKILAVATQCELPVFAHIQRYFRYAVVKSGTSFVTAHHNLGSWIV